MINKEFGGTVDRRDSREDGQFEIDLDISRSSLFKGLDERELVLLTHGDNVKDVADGFVASAHSGKIVAGKIAATSPTVGKVINERWRN